MSFVIRVLYVGFVFLAAVFVIFGLISSTLQHKNSWTKLCTDTGNHVVEDSQYYLTCVAPNGTTVSKY